MAEFIELEPVTEASDTVVIDETDDEENGNKENEVSDIDSFLDDTKKGEENDVKFYRQLENVSKLIDKTLQEEYKLSLTEAKNFNDFSNFCESSKDELGAVDEFKDSGKRLEKFEDTLFPKFEEHNTFPDSILYEVRFNVTEKRNLCPDNNFQEDIETIFNNINREKFQLELDNQKDLTNSAETLIKF